ncbi:MAG: o-succinylbenzoate synthase [Candidatus Competibacteraceae bacterium]|nr:o-succinylbenzoate synthase [Candidatus Competibacteraceae bacterium]
MTIRLATFQAFVYDLPLTTPLRIGTDSLTCRQGLLIRLEDRAGCWGYGEVAPLPGLHQEDLASALHQCKDLRPLVSGRELPELEPDWRTPLEHWLAPYSLYPSLCHGLESALLDLSACRQGHTLAGVLRPDGYRKTVSINGLLARDGEIRQHVHQLAGYPAVKLKVGNDSLEQEIHRVKTARALFGTALALRVDANRAWDFATALQFCEAVAACRLEYLEEPLRDPTRLEALGRLTGVPIALDETLAESRPESIIIPSGVIALVLKPSVLGGPTATARWLDLARQRGLKAVITSVFESGVGLAHLANCAAALLETDTPLGLDTYRWLGEDLPTVRFSATQATIDVDSVYYQARQLHTERFSRVV